MHPVCIGSEFRVPIPGPLNIFIGTLLGSGRYCLKMYWTKMVQNGPNDHFGQNDLIPNWILAFARPKWTKMVHFGLTRSILVHLGPPAVLWPFLILWGENHRYESGKSYGSGGPKKLAFQLVPVQRFNIPAVCALLILSSYVHFQEPQSNSSKN